MSTRRTVRTRSSSSSTRVTRSSAQLSSSDSAMPQTALRGRPHQQAATRSRVTSSSDSPMTQTARRGRPHQQAATRSRVTRSSSQLSSSDSPMLQTARRGRLHRQVATRTRASPYRTSRSQAGGSTADMGEDATPRPASAEPPVEIVDIVTPSRRPTPRDPAPLVDLTCDHEDQVSREEVFVLLENIARPMRIRPLDMRIRLPRLPANVDEPVVVEDSDAEDRTPKGASSSTIATQPVASPESPIVCPICFDGLNQMKEQKKQLYSTVCGHLFCQPCITAAIQGNRQCPTCRRTISLRLVHPVFV